jgi:hypothetical protein
MMGIGAGRVRTVPTSLVGLAWRAVVGVWRDFVWADLRDGVLSLRGLSPGTRRAVWLGFGLLVTVLAGLLLTDTLRRWSR